MGTGERVWETHGEGLGLRPARFSLGRWLQWTARGWFPPLGAAQTPRPLDSQKPGLFFAPGKWLGQWLIGFVNLVQLFTESF